MHAMSDVRIREAQPRDLHPLYALSRAALTFDVFSESLLAEKLSGPHAPGMHTRVWVASRRTQIVGYIQSLVHPRQRRGWIGLLVVEPHARRRGVASALLAHARAAWPETIDHAEVLAIPGNYFSPGLDPRYTAALCFFERHGFERFGDCVNMSVNLERPFATREDEARLAREGIRLRRATAADASALDTFFSRDFGEFWRFEAHLALRNTPPSLHLALRDGQVLGFAAHSTQNRPWGFFGPMGTTPAARGLGIGRVLLLRCLNDLRLAGHTTAVIPWVGPIGFYARACGARIERIFWRLRWQPG